MQAGEIEGLSGLRSSSGAEVWPSAQKGALSTPSLLAAASEAEWMGVKELGKISAPEMVRMKTLWGLGEK